MLIAEVNGKRAHAAKGTKGICPCCKAELIAKCGEVKIAHWSHKSKKNCDSWHEAETDWHRMWKNYFPENWQEIIKYDQETGEKHIADVCTENGFALEFQHSPIKPEERLSREQFYKNMNWVVDGTRLKNDYKKFENGIIKNARIISQIRYIEQQIGIQKGYNSCGREIFPEQIGNFLEISFVDKLLPKNWLNSNVPVVFDFKGLNEIDKPNDLRQFVFCLLPIKDDLHRYVIQIPVQIFIENVIARTWEKFVSDCINRLQKMFQQLAKTQNLRSYIKFYSGNKYILMTNCLGNFSFEFNF